MVKFHIHTVLVWHKGLANQYQEATLVKYIQKSHLPSFIMQQDPRLDSSVRRRARLGKSDAIRKLGRYHMGLTASRFVIEKRMSHDHNYFRTQSSTSRRLTFLKETVILQNNFVKLIPQLVPMNGLHANICVLQIGAVQSERVYISVQWKFVWEKIKMSVTSAYFECATGNRYHRIELADRFLLKYRYWTFTKITASASRKKF